MFDPLDAPTSKPFSPEKLLTFSVVGMLLGIGLCGAASPLHRLGLTGVVPVLMGSICFLASLLGLLVGLVWGILRAIFGRREL